MVESGLAIDAVAVVVRGHFNAAVFSPDWLLKHGLIGRNDADESQIEIISPQATSFSAPWFSCRITNDQLVFDTVSQPDFERLRDLVAGALTALPDTPIAALGINRSAHFPTESMERWHAIGDALAPKDFWNETLELPGLKSMTIWGVRPDKYMGRIQVQVEPSVRIQFGIYVAYNDHFDLAETASHPSSRAEFSLTQDAASASPTVDKIPIAIAVLHEEWRSSMDRSQAVIARLLSLGKAT